MPLPQQPLQLQGVVHPPLDTIEVPFPARSGMKRKKWVMGQDTANPAGVRYLAGIMCAGDVGRARVRPPRDWFTKLIHKRTCKSVSVRFDLHEPSHPDWVTRVEATVTYPSHQKNEVYVHGPGFKDILGSAGIQAGDLVRLEYEETEAELAGDGAGPSASRQHPPPVLKLAVIKAGQFPETAALLEVPGEESLDR